MKALQNNVENDDSNFEETCIDKNVDLVENAVEIEAFKENPNKEKPFTMPLVTQNAPPGQTLDLIKQYKRKGVFCDRDLIRIHVKALNKQAQIGAY